MVGVHGDSSVAIWSTISVGGMLARMSVHDSHQSFDEAAMEGIQKKTVMHFLIPCPRSYTSFLMSEITANISICTQDTDCWILLLMLVRPFSVCQDVFWLSKLKLWSQI